MIAAGARPVRAPTAARLAARSSRGAEDRAAAARWPWLLVAGAVVWNLISVRALTSGVAYLNDSSMHEQMVRFATAQLRAGHMPLSSWFPFLGEGSPQFLHYQSLPAILTGAVGLLIGPDVAFRWSFYLLWSLWPISVYLAARAFGGGRGAAGASAAIAPFLVSATGVGYEQHAYLWTGYGVWTQLWAMWTLPLAWGWSWRAVRDGHGYARAVLATALTVAMHFETGYLALAVLLCWPLIAGRPVLVRVRRAAVLLGGSLLAAAWVIVPLLAQRDWAAVNEALQSSGLVNGYGAHQVLVWLISGQLLDAGRLPVVTVLAAVGFGLAWLGWSSDPDGRALLIALALCLLLAFGRTTFGSLVDLIPGSADLFFRRFMMGVQLAALLLAGRGAAWLASRCLGLLEAPGGALADPPLPRPHARGRGRGAGARVVAAGRLRPPRRRSGRGPAPRRRHTGRPARPSIAVIKRRGGGRTYAGTPTNWGQTFTVGAVPVFKYLENQDVDEVGYTLRTASLMTNPENEFDERNPSDYRLFGIRYLILPAGHVPPVKRSGWMRSGRSILWAIRGGAYIQTGRSSGRSPPTARTSAPATERCSDPAWPLTAPISQFATARAVTASGRRRHARRSAPGTVSSDMPISPAARPRRRCRCIAREWRCSAPPMTRAGPPPSTAVAHRPHGRACARRRRPPAGTSQVVFRFHGYGDYVELLVLSGLSLAVIALAPLWVAARRQRIATEPGRVPADRLPGRRPRWLGELRGRLRRRPRSGWARSPPRR